MDNDWRRSGSLGAAIMRFDRKMRSENPGEFNKALLTMANIILQVHRVSEIPDDVSGAIAVKLQSLLRDAYPDEDWDEDAAGTGAAATT